MKQFTFNRILVVGAGTAGQQIAVQFARFGFSVVVYDVDPRQLANCQQQEGRMLQGLVDSGLLRSEQPAEILARIDHQSDRRAASEGVDLLIESVTEELETKRQVLREFHQLCPRDTVFTTNSSYFVPSRMATASGRPELFAAFHFHVPVWIANAVDVMPHPRTRKDLIDALCELAPRIGQVPIRTHHENWGYVFNAMLHPMLQSAIDLAARGVADYQNIDRAWMTVTKMPIGPFGIVDKIGVDTVYHVVQQWQGLQKDPRVNRAATFLQVRISQTHLGEKTGHGFYRYPDPEYQRKEFLSCASDNTPRASSEENTKQRFVESLVPAPLDSSTAAHLDGVSRIALCGHGSTADSLAETLARQGIEVCRPPRLESVAGFLAWFRDQKREKVFPHLWLVQAARPTGKDSPSAWDLWYEEKLQAPFELVQEWYRSLGDQQLSERATLLVVSEVPTGETATITGKASHGIAALAKACWMESTLVDGIGVCAKVIHFDADTPQELRPELAIQELIAAQQSIVTGEHLEMRFRHADMEVLFQHGERHVARYREDSSDVMNAPQLVVEENWLVTGGARGITHESALVLGQRYGAKLHLLGRTPLGKENYRDWSRERVDALKTEVMRSAYHENQKPDVAWHPWQKVISLHKALDRYERAGVEVDYHECDVSNARAVAQVVASLRERGVRIGGVLHGAGVENTCRLPAKTLAGFHETVKPKSLGVLSLLKALRDEPVKRFVAFGSLVGVFGGVGQVDYAMANESLRTLLREFAVRRPHCRFLTIHWPGWEEVGMASRPESRFMLEQSHLQLMPVAEGVRHFLEELAANNPESEIIIAASEELGVERLVADILTPQAVR